MTGRKNPASTDNEAMQEFRTRRLLERGEAVVGDAAPWLDGIAAPRADAEVRRSKHRENFRR